MYSDTSHILVKSWADLYSGGFFHSLWKQLMPSSAPPAHFEVEDAKHCPICIPHPVLWEAVGACVLCTHGLSRHLGAVNDGMGHDPSDTGLRTIFLILPISRPLPAFVTFFDFEIEFGFEFELRSRPEAQ
uniref:Uncharacterized protein n=1 Tax=Eutreptiella gymnastica TaxID=73025 RepID=A0A7S4G4N5_9EUGL|mmetsp:Transcript_83041/g.138786  ORF Transcript_83041/g.138786 Transcript_83041/m.138786 type:complete len:130 (-) Transcript_83041:120-509(-)